MIASKGEGDMVILMNEKKEFCVIQIGRTKNWKLKDNKIVGSLTL